MESSVQMTRTGELGGGGGGFCVVKPLQQLVMLWNFALHDLHCGRY